MEILEARTSLDFLVDSATSDIELVIRDTMNLSPAEQRATMTVAYPDLVNPYVLAAEELGHQFYEELPSRRASGFQPDTGPVHEYAMRNVDREGSTGRWMLTVPDVIRQKAVIDRVYNTFRTTQVLNVLRESTPSNDEMQRWYDMPATELLENTYNEVWARRPNPNACGYCRAQATRESFSNNVGGATHITRRSGERWRGSRYHDGCKCMPVAVRPGTRYTPPPEMRAIDREIKTAERMLSKVGGDLSSLDDIAWIMNTAGQFPDDEFQLMLSKRIHSPKGTRVVPNPGHQTTLGD